MTFAIKIIKTQLLIFVMYLEAKETARLYKLLSDQLGSDTTEAMFKYIDNKTERSVEATIKTLATKEDLNNGLVGVRNDLNTGLASVRKEMADLKVDIHKNMAEHKADNIKWMFVFWVGQVGAMLAIVFLFLKK